nr:small ubiquitin-related modifier 2-like [Ipomoea trifida]
MGGDGSMIELSILFHQDGISSIVRCRRDKMMKGLLVAYCDKKQVEYGDIQFLYEGKRLPVKKTPNEDGNEHSDYRRRWLDSGRSDNDGRKMPCLDSGGDGKRRLWWMSDGDGEAKTMELRILRR